MEFQRVGNHTIKCVISEEEIYGLGFTIEEIMSNGKRTQEFMSRIFDMAEEEFETKFDMGIKTVRADFLPDHTLSLTFSEHPGSAGMMEHIKDIVNGLLGSIPKDEIDNIKNSYNESLKEKSDSASADEDTENVGDIIAVITFKEFSDIITYANLVDKSDVPENTLYKLDDNYYLCFDLTDYSETEVQKLSMLTDEFATDVEVGSSRRAYLIEHGQVIIESQAIEALSSI